MIRDDRIQLNNRFREVFKLLLERGDVILNDRNGRGMGDFADKILGNRSYGHIVRAFLNPDDKRVIDYRHARAICREYGVNESYLVDGIGTPFGIDLPQATSTNNGPRRKGNILFTSVQAFAGSGVDVGGGNAASEEHEFFSMPGVSGSGLVAFPIEGNSMTPVIQDGDIVICRQINGVYEIKDNSIYAIKSNGSLWIKHVQGIRNNKGRIHRLNLISANHHEIPPFEEEVNEHTRLYQLIRVISKI